MDIDWNTSIINPKELIKISRGNNEIVFKYLHQFKELIPQRIESLEESLEVVDRKKVRQIIHQMSPQLQFFGINGMLVPLRRLELEYATMPIEDLSALVNMIINKLNLAMKDVDLILKENL